MTLDLDEIRTVADAVADAAGKAILPHFRRRDLGAASKEATSFDPVTEADRASETAMREVLARLRPEDGILGEEFAAVEGTSGLTWVLDPIDGTRGFLAGTPLWGVLIALSDADGPRAGMIAQPYIGERFWGAGSTAELIGPAGTSRLRTRAARPLADAILFTTFPEIGTAEEERAFRGVSGAVKLTRYGCDCYAYALLAAGQIDLVIEAGLAPYDIHAPIAVIEAAGGCVTDWEGNPAHDGGRVLAAANPEIHKAALARLQAGL